jgi:nitrogen fixation/metabolism regulation signal transduction histidine kinase
MRRLTTLLIVVAAVVAATLLFRTVQSRLSEAAFAFTVHPDVLAQLEASRADQRDLARLDPERRDLYRARFNELTTTVQRLTVLTHARERLLSRYNTILLVVFGASVFAVASLIAVRQARLQPRLARLRDALAALARGQTDLAVGVAGRDVVGRIAAMIEETSRVMAHDRRRLAALQNLSSWQEAARRHAHEMRTPLTGARLELARLRDLLEETAPERDEAMRQAAHGVEQELERLQRMATEFTSFARLPSPRLERVDVAAWLGEFVATYRSAWPGVDVRLGPTELAWAAIDREMLRQVLVNLCDNSARALAGRVGIIEFELGVVKDMVTVEVSDNGPGVDPAVRDRLFEPYATTRGFGEGMGLGLAISKKILLDHGGDLELADTSPSGATFRLTLPAAAQETP